MNIGNVQAKDAFALLWTQRHGVEESPFISGDDNYFYPYIVIHYRIKNLYNYIYRNSAPNDILEGAAYQYVVKTYATKKFYEIAIDHRRIVADEMLVALQPILDDMKTGIEVMSIGLKDIHPPYNVADAFEMVIASLQEKEMLINMALGYRNQNIPEKKGEAIRMLKEAEGFYIEKPLRAEGEAQGFLSRIPDDESIREITKKRLYLSAMMEALQGRNKIIVDPSAGSPEIWLNLKEILGSPGMNFEKGEF